MRDSLNGVQHEQFSRNGAGASLPVHAPPKENPPPVLLPKEKPGAEAAALAGVPKPTAGADDAAPAEQFEVLGDRWHAKVLDKASLTSACTHRMLGWPSGRAVDKTPSRPLQQHASSAGEGGKCGWLQLPEAAELPKLKPADSSRETFSQGTTSSRSAATATAKSSCHLPVPKPAMVM